MGGFTFHPRNRQNLPINYPELNHETEANIVASPEPRQEYEQAVYQASAADVSSTAMEEGAVGFSHIGWGVAF